jgi:glucose dehydrogenase
MIGSEAAGEPRKLITHSARNRHLYTMDRHNGQIIGAKPPHHKMIFWTYVMLL